MLPETVKVPKIAVVDKVSLPAKQTALVIVDMQNDFAHPDGKLYGPAAREIIPRIASLLERARAKGVRVVYTQDTHYKDDPVEFPIWGQHVVKGTWGWQIVEELKPREGDIVIEKMRYDAFFGTPLDHVLRMYGVRHLVVTGTVANICVLHTVASARLRLYDVVVPIDAIAALNEFDYAAALRQMDFLYKVTLTTTQGVEFS
ncbi:cysteine hydrolase family protein [Pyrobaculum aerophilum]|uniref:Isochorismatase, putative n=2 Tax=Pyrobaculum aerophilum TaxID=13773 RepID=Q8ZU08_PYRAE|nr:MULTISPECIES: isochorismatase family cysteine hydrolase [Pyrobaculum]AAL64601.1 isochorismatase, putative [Pyrobaculum aerophilum str. IM2]MCX8137238.1 cysteine hydrolase [Pyrobaculum aerophilum]RFA96679.1 cysteine hydrolase [Pyrobaculum aerophilum]RFB00307.1 cysteine hydrolase [Pyrobaculum aerophilum]HII47445.1 cysteine hydrolase [Pyrobaculum aerophilum]